MAEINFNNLYNQLKPMEKRYYDQQFQKSYNPNQENIMLSSQPAYEQMKAVYDAQQQVPEKSFLDKIPFFGSASAAEMPQVPNLTYGNIDLPFDLRTGVTNTTAASPFLKSMADIDASGVINSDLVNQLIMENQIKANQFDPRNIQSIFPTNFPSNIRQDVPLQNLGIDTSYGVANEEDVEQEFLPDQEPSGIAKLFEFLGKLPTPGNILRNILPEQDPRATGIRNFYSPYEGLTSTGSIASGIMKGYNPVSGGFLNMITGGKFGQPTQYGLSGAMQRRIENILGRKIAQTDASRAKVALLRNLQRAEMRDRADRGESLSSIGKSTFSGPGMAFERRSGGSSGKKGTSSERNYGGR
jgi:hypothetical protein